jgi:hypothetical protein
MEVAQLLEPHHRLRDSDIVRRIELVSTKTPTSRPARPVSISDFNFKD